MSKAFQLSARLHSFKHAANGIRILLGSQHNAWLHLFATLTSLPQVFIFLYLA